MARGRQLTLRTANWRKTPGLNSDGTADKTMPEELFLPNVIDVNTLSDLVTRHVPMTILDVRTPAEFEAAHIPGSYNVPLDQLPEHAGELGSVLGGPAILVCRSGARARQAE